MERTKTTTETRTDVDRDLRGGKDTNPDPITGAPGAHPGGTAAGTTAGGLAGAAAGAAIGSVVPGIGTVVGGVAGLVLGGVGGGLAGKAVAEAYDPTAEDAYWREQHKTRSYYKSGDYDYDRDYKPAYQFGWETAAKNPTASFGQAESELSQHWEKTRGSSRLKWDQARDVTRDAWDRIRSSSKTTRTLKEGEKAAIPVVKEDIQVGKREVQSSGGVRVESTVKERPVSEQINLREEHVNVERRPVDRPASAADLNAFQQGTIEVTERKEVPVVSKEARVVEEVRVGKEATTRTETVRDTVRETDVKVENLGTTSSSSSRTFDTYGNDFRTHFQQRYASMPDAKYEVYEPAYRYGYNLATEKQYSSYNDWNSLETNARSSWEKHNPGTWEKFKDTIRHAWDKVRGRA